MQPTVKAIPNGMQTITPHIIVWDAARAVEWYKEALGAEERSRIPLPGGKLMSVELWFGDSTVMVADEFVERDHHPLVHWLLAREVVVPTSQVLHEATPNDDHPGATVMLEPAHRPQPRLEAAVVALDPVVGVAVGAVPRRWQPPR